MFFENTKEDLDLTMLDIKLMTSITTGLSDQEIPTDSSYDYCETLQVFPAHDLLSDRVCKTLYYGKLPATDRPSLSLTQLAVDKFADVGIHKLGRLDMNRAAEMSREVAAGPTSLVLALIYLDRLRRSNPDYLRSVCSADLFLVSMLVASKFLHDDGEEDEVFNDEWAKAGGHGSGSMDIREFNKLEMEFLAAMDWRIHVGIHEFEDALNRVERTIAWRALNSRGWATYTDLDVLTTTNTTLTGVNGRHAGAGNNSLEPLLRLAVELAAKMTAVCMATYATGLLTLVGSAALLHHTSSQFGPENVCSSLRALSSIGTSGGTAKQPSLHPNQQQRGQNNMIVPEYPQSNGTNTVQLYSYDVDTLAAASLSTSEPLSSLDIELGSNTEGEDGDALAAMKLAPDEAHDRPVMMTRPANLLTASLLVATLAANSVSDREAAGAASSDTSLEFDLTHPDDAKPFDTTKPSTYGYREWTIGQGSSFTTNRSISTAYDMDVGSGDNHHLLMAEWLSAYSKKGDPSPSYTDWSSSTASSSYLIPGQFTTQHQSINNCSMPTQPVSCMMELVRTGLWNLVGYPDTNYPGASASPDIPEVGGGVCPVMRWWLSWSAGQHSPAWVDISPATTNFNLVV